MVRKIHQTNTTGTINGLYATVIGTGGITPIHIKTSYVGNSFELKMTGEQGNIMKESVEKSYTTAMNLVKKYYQDIFLTNNTNGLHIDAVGHYPKDGPSAGSAITIAFLSVILDKNIRNDHAMTGVIELSGKITKIGGLEYKLPGAKKAGVKTVLIPQENEEDYLNIKINNPKLFEDGFNIVLVDNIYQAVEHMLIESDGSSFDTTNYFI
jgi:ATP-dependent Lon protease